MTSSIKNLEDLTIVWLDVDRIHENKNDYFDTKTRLRQCNHYMEIYNDTNECCHGINNNENVLLIVPGSICEIFIPQIVDLKQIVFIYILYLNQDSSDTCQLKDIPKLRGVFPNKNQLIEKLKQDIKSYSKSLIPISIINEKSIRALNKEYTMFMWTQLLLNVLIQIPQTNHEKMIMLNECRSYYAEDQYQLNLIDEFEKNYNADLAISWYTRDSFVYKQLNKALRTQDIDVIFKYRFIITDIYKQLKKLYNESVLSLEETLVVYRGQSMSCNDLEKIKNNINGLISMNTYTSTTRNKNLALIYAGNGSDRPILESVLFEIIIEKNVASDNQPFADIQHKSQFGMGEEEILLAMGMIFKIQSVEQLIDNGIVWQVKLILSESVVNKDIDMLFNYLKMDVTTSISNIATLGSLLSQMGKYNKAKRYYQMMLDELPSDDPAIPLLLNNIGKLYSHVGNYKKALEYYTESDKKYKMQKLSENVLLLASLYHNMGSLYQDEDNNKTALEYYNKALEICRTHSSIPSFSLSALIYSGISGILQDDGEFDKALEHLQDALKIELKFLPSNHFRIASTYNNIGGVYLLKGDYNTALQCFEIALDVGLKSLPNNHENIQIYREHIQSVKERMTEMNKNHQ
ncbi:unnamed protein product [Didymodactylos carnosus]|uniref:Uncharacterized protein n=1 Tax=Didymodactylos carnosus TaxID=1234261 RepID=A0A815F7N9_9BILA|nr:unnamed protein product [Didymodactylos carnosus]CAF4167477.1 unnamed protein product [Didymodactylos carnosus]